MSINAARNHACENNLIIDYLVGRGESLPFPDSTFDIVACCDVIEHVEDSDKVMSEASRTLKEGGIFFFDTINRTLVSKMMIIKILQQWRLTRIFPLNTHIWERFINPDELVALMQRYNIANQEMRGIEPGDKLAMLRVILAIKKGRILNNDLAAILGLCESENLDLSYMGFGIKHGNSLN